MEQYRAFLRRQASLRIDRRGHPDCDVSDLVQQTLLQAHEKAHQFRGQNGDDLRPWLLRILCNQIIDAMRKAARRSRLFAGPVKADGRPASAPGPLPQVVDRDVSPSHRAILQERRHRLEQALDSLPADQREALRLRFLEECSVAETALRMGRSTASVAGLIRRGLAALREAFPDVP